MRGLREAAKEVLKGNSEINETNYQIDYNTVFKKVAEYYGVSPEEVDNQDDDTKDKIYQTIDKCWDPGDNKVPDTCPVDSLHENQRSNHYSSLYEAQSQKVWMVAQVEFGESGYYPISIHSGKSEADKEAQQLAKNKKPYSDNYAVIEVPVSNLSIESERGVKEYAAYPQDFKK